MANPQVKAKPAAQPGNTKNANQNAEGKKGAEQPKGRKRAVGVREELQELKEVGAFGLWLRGLVESTPGLTTSFIIHAVLLILLALITLTPDVEKIIPNLLALTESDKEEEIEKLDENIEIMDDVQVDTEVSEVVETEVIKEEMEISSFNEAPAAPISVETSDFGLEHAPKNNLLNKMGSTTGKGFDGRGEAARKAMVASGGGSAGSEAAVGHALKWIMEHQMADGGWNFNHGINNKHVGPVNNPGTEKSTAGATAMALLPFLGAGQTHKEGKYKDTVQRGLYYLGKQMKVTANGGDLTGLEGGSLYCHGLAAITMCEAYALTQDKSLAVPAQQTINFIVYAQDKTGGGWRYSPGQPGDTSVVGWQLMALKSGHLAYLDVPPKTIAGAINFLNLVQSDSGSKYGYTGPGGGPATTAVGLLCRMYLGWKQDNGALQNGVDFLSRTGPQKANMYFNYYATQVLHHWGGDPWKKWNDVMRDQLVNSQVQGGTYTAEKGSWWTVGQSHGERGGRLYETSLSCMTLEVYYRHMPLYRQNAAQGEEF
jgi:hypothetical protein